MPLIPPIPTLASGKEPIELQPRNYIPTNDEKLHLGKCEHNEDLREGTENKTPARNNERNSPPKPNTDFQCQHTTAVSLLDLILAHKGE